jgi:hypothetical protein
MDVVACFIAAALGQDDVGLETDQFRRIALHPLRIAPAEAKLDLDGSSLDPAEAGRRSLIAATNDGTSG